MLEQKATIGRLEYQFHQVAMYYPNYTQLVRALDLWDKLGHSYTEDQATLRGKTKVTDLPLTGPGPEEVWKDSVVEAVMLFNYDIMPMEFEALHYRGLGHRYATAQEPLLSHFSVYTEDLEKEAAILSDALGYGPYYKFTTEGHTNPRVKGKKRFTETIFDTRSLIGADLKFIQKVPWDYQG